MQWREAAGMSRRAAVTRGLSAALFAAAAAFLVQGVVSGGLHVAFIFVIPLVYGSGFQGLAAAALIVTAFVILALSGPVQPLGGYRGAEGGEGGVAGTGRRSFGGVIFIGPVPIVFGSGRKVTAWMVVAGIVLSVLLILAFILWNF